MKIETKMKSIFKCFFVFFIFFLINVSSTLAKNKESQNKEIKKKIVSKTKITSVTVYPTGAEIIRKGKVFLKEGENTFIIPNLSPDIIDNSVHIFFNNKNIKILEIKIKRNFLYEEKKIQLEKELEDLKKKIKELEARKKAIKISSEFIEKILDAFSQKENISITPESIKSFAEFIKDSLFQNFIEIIQLESKIVEFKEKAKKIKNQLEEIKKTTKFVKDIIVSVYSKEPIQTNFKVSYLINEAEWYPYYIISADTYKNKISIDLYAQVRQTTGKLWNNVKLIISTQKPYFGIPPELEPWYIFPYTPFPSKSKLLKAPQFLEKSIKKFRKKESLQEIHKTAYIKELKTSVSFIVPYPITISSNKRFHKIFLISNSTKVDFKYYVIPELFNVGLIYGKFTNPFLIPLARKIVVNIDGNYAGEFYLKNKILPGEKTKIFLGKDEKIRVKKELIRRYVEYSGIVSKRKIVHYEYKIEITNGKKKKINLSVKDRFPISEDERIKVTLESPNKKEAEIDERRGFIKWKISLEPGKKKELILKFKIEYPEGLEIKGL